VLRTAASTTHFAAAWIRVVVPTVMAGKAKAPMMRFLQLRFVALVEELGLNIEVGHEYGPFNPICDAGSRGKTAEMEAIMANLDLQLEYADVPAAAGTAPRRGHALRVAAPQREGAWRGTRCPRRGGGSPAPAWRSDRGCGAPAQ
jgi:hypothetical protein